MTRLSWGEPGTRLYETGIDRGVFYPRDGVGVPWNGLIAVSEAPSGSDIISGHYDGEKFRQQRTSDSFSAEIKAYTYPKEMEEYDGNAVLFDGGLKSSSNKRKIFNLSYRTLVGNDDGNESSYLVHLVYNAILTPSDKSFISAGSNTEAIPFSWKLDTVPNFLPTGEASAHLIVNPRIAYPWAVNALEDILYGTSDTDPSFPSMTEVIELFENASILRITDNGDGTWTADGPDEAFNIVGDYFEITWPSAVYIDTVTYKISSL